VNIWITKTPAQINEASDHTLLKKNLRAVDLAALGIGSVVGTGIFVATGQGSSWPGPASCSPSSSPPSPAPSAPLPTPSWPACSPWPEAPIHILMSLSEKSSPGSSAGT